MSYLKLIPCFGKSGYEPILSFNNWSLSSSSLHNISWAINFIRLEIIEHWVVISNYMQSKMIDGNYSYQLF